MTHTAAPRPNPPSNWIHSPRTPQAAFVRLLILLAMALPLALTGCGKEAARTDAAASKGEKAETRASWQSDKCAGRITAVRSEAGRMEVDYLMPGGSAVPSAPVEYTFCIPDTQAFTLKIRRYAVGGRVVQEMDAKDKVTVTSGSQALDPAETLSVQRAGYLRDRLIGHLTFHEGFWRPWSKEPQADLTATVEIRWPAGGEAKADANPTTERGMERVLSHFVANPGDLGRWPVKQAPLAKDLNAKPTDPRPLAPGAGPWLRLRIGRDGLYKLTAQDLARAGQTGPDALARVRLFANGKPVAVQRVKSAGADAVLFYGWKSRTPYSAEQTYWVTFADARTSETAIPAAEAALLQGTAKDLPTLHKVARCNRDNALKIAHAEFMRIVDATWVDAELIKDKPISIPLTLQAPLAPEVSTTTLKGVIKFRWEGNPALWGGTEAELLHDGQSLARFTFTPEDPSFNPENPSMDRPVKLPRAIFDAAGRTTLTLSVANATSATLPSEDNKEGIWFDSAEVAYEGLPSFEEGRLTLDAATATTTSKGALHRLALAAPGIPEGAELAVFAVNAKQREARRLPIENRSLRFAVADGWQAEVYDAAQAAAPALEPVTFQDDLLKDDGADVLLVTHPMFLESVKPLVEMHKKMGLKTRVVDVTRIYDLFGDGMLSPLALRAYLGYAATHWRALPQYLLLFGDCSEDYLGAYRSTAVNLVPSYTYTLNDEVWPSDYWYSLLVGDDPLPDLMVARIPVNNVEDARSMIEKTVRYAGSKMLGPWRGRMAFAADNAQGYHAVAEGARTELTPAAYESPRVYLDELPLNDNWYVNPSRLDKAPVNDDESIRKVSNAATNKLKEMFNSGAPVVEYFGHGSPNLWAHERIWFGGGSPNRDTQYLKADGRYAFIINYACATGKIDYPVEPWNICISEDFLRTADGGAIGLFVPAGFGSMPLQKILMHHWHGALFQDHLRGIGELATLVRARFASDQLNESHLYMYQLLGDPTVELQMADTVRNLELAPKAMHPGAGPVEVALTEMEPARGKAQLWIENDHGEKLWEGQPFDYAGGAIRQSLTVPAGVESPERLRVALYAWNEEEKRDLLAGGRVTLERPAVLIRSAQATRAGEREIRFAMELENAGVTASDEFKLAILPVGARDAAPLAEQTLKLAGGERRRVELTAKGGSDTGLLTFDAVLTSPQPPDDPTVSFPLRRRIALAPAGWTGWAPALGAWEHHSGSHTDQITVCAVSAQAPKGQVNALWRTTSGTLVTTLPLTFIPQDGAFISTATVPLTMGTMPQADHTVELVNVIPGAAPKSLGTMRLSDLPRVGPRLRIKPESVHYAPQAPTDGETVFVSYNVENAGDIPSIAGQPVLLNKPQSEGGQPLGYRSEFPKTDLPSLGVGRSKAMTLRWDPIDNAGVQQVTIDLDATAGRSAEEINDQTASLRLFVRTKSQLARGRLLAPVKTATGAFKLRVEVANEGETEAHNVEVTYYRTPDKKPEEKLGSILLKEIPGKGTAQASLECQLNEATDKPVVEIRLKGSAQVITN